MDERSFWQQIRRGLIGMSAASNNPDMRAAIGQMIAAIEARYTGANTGRPENVTEIQRRDDQRARTA